MATPTDHREARRIATEAGELLVRMRDAHPDPVSRRQALKDAGDAGSQVFIAAQLRDCFPDDAVLSEEAVDTDARLSADRVWIIDPVDGTREFGEPPRDDWAVHVALWERGKELTAGAVALPAMGLTLGTDEAPVLPAAVDGPPRIVVSRTRPPAQAERVRAALDGELLPMGSAGAKAMAVVRGVADAYVHAGGQYEWDSAAPAVVALAAGLHVSRLDGSPLRYNRADPYLPDLIICRPELAQRALDALAAA
ncbi:3'(2'),5'-bisphosphate nucleotidase CysQ [Euzebya pacifica]|uniref:3'(2'),5'-bisphosphate nucleotidase CysQ n=1 Tax=Euzebya pacifica TaxID=1608957 RepID=UPI0030F9C4E7